MKLKCPNCDKKLPDCELFEQPNGTKEYVLKCNSCDWGCTKKLWDYNLSLIKRIIMILKEQKYEDIEEQLIIYNKEVIGA